MPPPPPKADTGAHVRQHELRSHVLIPTIDGFPDFGRHMRFIQGLEQ